MRRALVIACVLALAPAAWGQDAGVPDDGGTLGPDASNRVLIDGPTMLGIARPQASAAASPSELRLGEKLTLFVEVVYDEQVTVSLSSGLELEPAFDELKRSSVDERRSDGTRKRTYQVQLQVWEVGDLRIPPIQVGYTVGGSTSWVVTNEVPIRVVQTIDSIDDPNAFLGATPPVPLARRDWRMIAVGVGLAMVLAALFVVWLVNRIRRRPLQPVERPTPDVVIDRLTETRTEVTSHESIAEQGQAQPFALQLFVVTVELRRRLGDAARRALDALDALEQSRQLATAPIEGFRTLVGIVHAFAVEHHQLPPRHRTTSELLVALARARVTAPVQAGFAGWLERGDRVKFGADRVDDDGARALSEARELIVRASGLSTEVAS